MEYISEFVSTVQDFSLHTQVGGTIVYSTCSLNPIENEAVVAHVVSQAAGAVEICECPGTLASLMRRPGLLHWR
jgi:16S rRNA C967 or C1407 C5-methylase (RsmB/RsmF family)